MARLNVSHAVIDAECVWNVAGATGERLRGTLERHGTMAANIGGARLSA